nr:91KD protein [Fijivirus sp.]
MSKKPPIYLKPRQVPKDTDAYEVLMEFTNDAFKRVECLYTFEACNATDWFTNMILHPTSNAESTKSADIISQRRNAHVQYLDEYINQRLTGMGYPRWFKQVLDRLDTNQFQNNHLEMSEDENPVSPFNLLNKSNAISLFACLTSCFCVSEDLEDYQTMLGPYFLNLRGLFVLLDHIFRTILKHAERADPALVPDNDTTSTASSIDHKSMASDDIKYRKEFPTIDEQSNEMKSSDDWNDQDEYKGYAKLNVHDYETYSSMYQTFEDIDLTCQNLPASLSFNQIAIAVLNYMRCHDLKIHAGLKVILKASSGKVGFAYSKNVVVFLHPIFSEIFDVDRVLSFTVESCCNTVSFDQTIEISPTNLRSGLGVMVTKILSSEMYIYKEMNRILTFNFFPTHTSKTFCVIEKGHQVYFVDAFVKKLFHKMLFKVMPDVASLPLTHSSITLNHTALDSATVRMEKSAHADFISSEVSTLKCFACIENMRNVSAMWPAIPGNVHSRMAEYKVVNSEDCHTVSIRFKIPPLTDAGGKLKYLLTEVVFGCYSHSHFLVEKHLLNRIVPLSIEEQQKKRKRVEYVNSGLILNFVGAITQVLCPGFIGESIAIEPCSTFSSFPKNLSLLEKTFNIVSLDDLIDKKSTPFCGSLYQLLSSINPRTSGLDWLLNKCNFYILKMLMQNHNTLKAHFDIAVSKNITRSNKLSEITTPRDIKAFLVPQKWKEDLSKCSRLKHGHRCNCQSIESCNRTSATSAFSVQRDVQKHVYQLYVHGIAISNYRCGFLPINYAATCKRCNSKSISNNFANLCCLG